MTTPLDKKLIRAEGVLLEAALGSATYLGELTAEGNITVDDYGQADFDLLEAAKEYKAVKKAWEKEHKARK